MAVEFTLELATTETAEQIRTQAVEAAGIPTEPWLHVGMNTPSERDPITADFGIRPTVWVLFALSGDDIAALQDTMVHITSRLLDHTPADAILHHQYDMIWLIRRSGSLVVSDHPDIWTPARLALLPKPYSRAPLEFSQG
ncbi:SitI3 family protein [Nocardia sp. NPDC052112]|uniref:SitI3 family protein n=1 Tax=Nocardia sp. NPDC052112 TaxID=3155646 RepID=UPI00344932A8